MLKITYINGVFCFKLISFYSLSIDMYTQIKTYKFNLLTLNLLVTATMKNAAKCENVL